MDDHAYTLARMNAKFEVAQLVEAQGHLELASGIRGQAIRERRDWLAAAPAMQTPQEQEEFMGFEHNETDDLNGGQALLVELRQVQSSLTRIEWALSLTHPGGNDLKIPELIVIRLDIPAIETYIAYCRGKDSAQKQADDLAAKVVSLTARLQQSGAHLDDAVADSK